MELLLHTTKLFPEISTFQIKSDLVDQFKHLLNILRYPLPATFSAEQEFLNLQQIYNHMLAVAGKISYENYSKHR